MEQPRDLNTPDDVRLETVEEARLSSGPSLGTFRERQLKRKHKRTFAVNSDNHRKLDDEISVAERRHDAPSFRNQSHFEFLPQPEQPVGLLYGHFLRFRNGKGDQIGTLELQFRGTPEDTTQIDLNRLSAKQPLPAGWENSKDSIIAAFPRKSKAKAREIDDAAIGWVKRKITNPLPWMIEPDTGSEALEEYAVEHLRGGNLAENQMVLTVHVY